MDTSEPQSSEVIENEEKPVIEEIKIENLKPVPAAIPILPVMVKIVTPPTPTRGRGGRGRGGRGGVARRGARR